MPFVYIKSLPQVSSANTSLILKEICVEMGKVIDLPPAETIATWEILAAGAYAHGESTCDRQNADSHPILVDLLAFEGRPKEKIGEMLECIARVLSRGCDLPIKNIFINYREATYDAVFADGEVIRRS